MAHSERNRICIAILALGGQGGGVLADWIEQVAHRHGWHVQGTSVPGVAQRTGSTVYYVELARPIGDHLPVMSQMPVPGDVDVVIASELMEAGRAMVRGFVSKDRTTLISSTHRIYAISEKSAMGDGRGKGERILETAPLRAKRFIGFDMEAATERSGSVISAIMFGALAGSGALPFPRASFEDAIRESRIAVESNLAGFAQGAGAAERGGEIETSAAEPAPEPTTATGRRLADLIRTKLPRAAHYNALHGVRRLMDYQDAAYAEAYLSRLTEIAALDAADGALTAEFARHLALWMSYEDTIRVADLKTRASRVERVRGEVQAKSDQLLQVTEFMHPRLQEVCETLPAFIGARILASPGLSRRLGRFFRSGRHVTTTSLFWFLTLSVVAGMRRWRRSTLRYQEEMERIARWTDEVKQLARRDVAVALEWVVCQRLIKGYGDTFERGLRNLEHIGEVFFALPQAQQTAEWLREARKAALADEGGEALAAFLPAHAA
jgi:indolepyruvate ferredoxin oxidoreductase beta subunit